MANKHNNVIFKSMDEYRKYYASPPKKQQKKGSKYYRIGENIAKMACEKAANQLPAEPRVG